MNSACTDSVTLRLARAVLPYTANAPFAATAALGIRTEAEWRRLADRELALATTALRRPTRAQRRRRQERAEAQTLRPQPNGHGARRPAVHWHEGGSGPALLLLNGWTASGLLWPEGWIRGLEQTHRVIRVDNRGTGWSRSAPAPFTIAELAGDARDVLRACGVERATVLGLSMGGMIAQELALRHPDRVDRLVLVATAPPVPAQLAPDPAPFLAALRGPAAGQDLADYLTRLWGGFTGAGFASSHPDVLAELVAQILRRVTPRRRVYDQLRAIRSWYGAGRLRRLDVPTTVVHGNRDPLIPVGNGMRLSRLIPDAGYLELDGVGHLVAHEAGPELLKILGSPDRV